MDDLYTIYYDEIKTETTSAFLFKIEEDIKKAVKKDLDKKHLREKLLQKKYQT